MSQNAGLQRSALCSTRQERPPSDEMSILLTHWC